MRRRKRPPHTHNKPATPENAHEIVVNNNNNNNHPKKNKKKQKKILCTKELHNKATKSVSD